MAFALDVDWNSTHARLGASLTGLRTQDPSLSLLYRVQPEVGFKNPKLDFWKYNSGSSYRNWFVWLEGGFKNRKLNLCKYNSGSSYQNLNLFCWHSGSGQSGTGTGTEISLLCSCSGFTGYWISPESGRNLLDFFPAKIVLFILKIIFHIPVTFS